jgi:hypothetical protein
MSPSARDKRHTIAAGPHIAGALAPKELLALGTAIDIAMRRVNAAERRTLSLKKGKLRQAFLWKAKHPAAKAAITRKRRADWQR